MKIISNHAHIMPDNNDNWPDGNAEMLINHLDYCEIEQTVIFPPFAMQMDNDMKKCNMWALEQVLKHSDRFIPAATLNPIDKQSIEIMDELYTEGVRLIKIHPSIYKHKITDPAAHDFYARSEELGVILNYHTGPHGTRLADATPYDFDDILWKYPKLKMNFEHIGGRPFRELFLAIICNMKNRAFGGITSILSNETSPIWRMKTEILQEFIDIAGADKFIFGLDFPWNSAETNKKDIKIIRNLNLSVDEKENILGKNLLAILK